jgi:RimJ/RimL family protein N-acetyltransferase
MQWTCSICTASQWQCASGTPPHTCAEQTAEYISHEYQERLQWVICIKGTNRAIGQIGYIAIDAVPGLGYIVHPDYWGNGYATILYIFTGPAIDDLYELYRSRCVTIDRAIDTMP